MEINQSLMLMNSSLFYWKRSPEKLIVDQRVLHRSAECGERRFSQGGVGRSGSTGQREQLVD
jgi:hypothetical protein